MMTISVRYLSLLMIFVGVVTGCAASRQEHFYTLLSTAVSTPPIASDSIAIIEPMRVPDIVDRPQLVISRDNNEVLILEEQRWAAPLKAEIARVIANRIEAATGKHVVVYPDVAARPPRYKIDLTIERFESRFGAQALVEAHWRLKSTTGDFITSGHSTEIEPVSTKDYAALVSAHSRALARIGDVLASTIGMLEAQFSKTKSVPK
jgi:uncharacterized protein